MANLTTVVDPVGDQTSGGKQNDLVEATAGHAGRKLVHTASVDAAKSNAPPELLIRSRHKLYFIFSTPGGGIVTKSPTGAVTGRAKIVQADDNTWRFVFRRRAVGRPRLGYRWAVAYGGAHDQPDSDRLPDKGFIRHKFG